VAELLYYFMISAYVGFQDFQSVFGVPLESLEGFILVGFGERDHFRSLINLSKKSLHISSNLT